MFKSESQVWVKLIQTLFKLTVLPKFGINPEAEIVELAVTKSLSARGAPE